MRIIDQLDMANQQIKSVADGVLANDAATWGQVQLFVQGLSPKTAVRAASTANVNVSSPGASIDSVALVNNNRVLLKDQTTASENGLWVWSGASTPLTRSADGVTGELVASSTVFVQEGSVNADQQWVLTTDGTITVGTTAQTWVQFGKQAVYTAGNGITISSGVVTVVATVGGGLTVTSNGVQVDYSKVVAKYSVTIGDNSTTSFTITHNIGTTDVSVTLKNLTTGKSELMSYTTPTVNTVGLVFPTAPTTGQYRITVQG